jgi:hypothetical protein
VQGARALLDRALERGDLRAGAPSGLLLGSLYGAVLIKIILSSPDERARLAASPGSTPRPLVDFVLGALLAAGPARAAQGSDGGQRQPRA